MRNYKIHCIYFIVLCLAFYLISCSSSVYKEKIIINKQPLYLEIAYSDEARRIGLMNRDSLGENNGMLFIFDKEEVLHFWMKNTTISLSIAFLRSNGLVIGIYDMEPLSLESVSSIYPCKYAIEVNKGWFSKAGLKPGDVVTLPSEEKMKKASQ